MASLSGISSLYFRTPPVNEFHGLRLVTPALSEPLTVAEALAQSKIDAGDDDPSIPGYISAARAYVEGHTKKLLGAQTWRLSLERWPRVNYIEIPLGPVLSVTSVTYKNSDNVVTTMTVDDDYLVDLEPPQARVVLPFAHIWPPVVMQTGAPIQVTFRAGYLRTASSVNVVGTAVSWVSGDKFDPSMANGTCTTADADPVIASVESATALTLADSAGTLTGASFKYSNIPAYLTQAMALLIGHWYENREAVVIGKTATVAAEVQMGVARLLSMGEVHRF